MNPIQQKLEAIIKKEIDYDASQECSEIKCQHCGRVVRPEVLNYWIDHKDVLVGHICKCLGLRMEEPVRRILDDAWVTGKVDADATELAKSICEEILLED